MSILRRLLAIGSTVAAFAALSVLLAPGASADTPEGWPDPPEVGAWGFLLVLVVFPLALFLVIALLAFAPSLAKGEHLGTSATTPESQWLGGPDKDPAALPASEETADDAAAAGGAGSRW
ncbi:MAG: hypothetical protein CMH83_11355 [Nocardioides sp.]|nr:hypothetical protein [Nocardioides sp.]